MQAIVERFKKGELWSAIKGPGLNNNIVQYMKMLVALPLLPPQHIPQAVEAMRPGAVLVGVNDGDVGKANRIHEYVDTFWIGRIGPDRLSVGLCPRSINNDLESYHAKLLRKIRLAHPNIWTFLGKLFAHQSHDNFYSVIRLTSIDAKGLQPKGADMCICCISHSVYTIAISIHLLTYSRESCI